MRKTSEILKQIGLLISELGQSLESPAEPKPESQSLETGKTEGKFSKVSQNLIDKLILLVNSDDWPEAVPSEILVQTEEDKAQRASDIIESYVELESGVKFLDFGCGEGHVARAASSKAAMSIGYDPALAVAEQSETLLLTKDFADVVAHAPYDVILLYDVLDHCENPVEALQQIKSVCGSETKVVICCHPWCGRHGGHLYRTFNKAFVHLLPDEVLDKVLNGEKPIFCQKILYPVQTYNGWFKDAGFISTYSFVERAEIEDFFQTNNLVKQYILDLFNQSNFPQKQMDQLFVKYHLRIK